MRFVQRPVGQIRFGITVAGATGAAAVVVPE